MGFICAKLRSLNPRPWKTLFYAHKLNLLKKKYKRFFEVVFFLFLSELRMQTLQSPVTLLRSPYTCSFNHHENIYKALQ